MAEQANQRIFIIIKKIIWNSLFVIAYPVITSFSILFVSLLWIFSQLSTLLSRIGTNKTTLIEFKKPTWKDLDTVGRFHIKKLFVDDILFGPTYYTFKAEPDIQALNGIYFGDFYFKCFDGILLQRWNTTVFKEIPDFSLMFLNAETAQLIEVKKIRSFSWNAHFVSEREVKVKWFNGSEGGELVIDKESLKNSLIKIE